MTEHSFKLYSLVFAVPLSTHGTPMPPNPGTKNPRTGIISVDQKIQITQAKENNGAVCAVATVSP